MKSFIFLVLLISIVFGAVYYIQHEKKVGGAPRILRNSFLFNERVFKILSDSKRKSLSRAIILPGKRLRINGDIGMTTQLPRNYLITIENGQRTIKISPFELKLLPRSSFVTEFRCIEGWSEDIQYAGVTFADFIKHYNLGKKPNGNYFAYVGLETPDKEYYVSIDMESMLHPQTILADELNLLPLKLKNGAPLRLIIPIKYGIKSLKRIGRIYFSDQRPPDYWAERGYDWYSGL
ncbi:MAG: molybdopterin-dependent oxidoreductase [Bacteriovoracaceae bacterium]